MHTCLQFARSQLPKIFAVLVDRYHHIVLAMSFKLKVFTFIFAVLLSGKQFGNCMVVRLQRLYCKTHGGRDSGLSEGVGGRAAEKERRLGLYLQLSLKHNL